MSKQVTSIPRMKVEKRVAFEGVFQQINRDGTYVNGPSLDLFRKELQQYFRKTYVTLTSSGFTSILLAIKSLGIRKEKILLPSLSTCFSMVNAVKASGNIPVFADTEELSPNLSLQDLDHIVADERVKVILSPNHFGILSKIREFKQLGVHVIEDCAQSFLNNLDQISAADLQIFSFYPTKIINAIDGGAVLTNDENWGKYCMQKVYYEDQLAPSDETYFNFRLSNLHAAIGLESLKSIPESIHNLKVILKSYKEILSPFEFVKLLGDHQEFLYKAVLKFRTEKQKNIAKQFLQNDGIGCFEELIPIADLDHLQKNARRLVKTHLSIPYYPSLETKETNYICDKLSKILRKI